MRYTAVTRGRAIMMLRRTLLRQSISTKVLLHSSQISKEVTVKYYDVATQELHFQSVAAKVVGDGPGHVLLSETDNNEEGIENVFGKSL
jgi:hypothetical protein